MSNCEYSPLVSRFHDGEVTPAERLAVKNHLVDCAPCASEYRQLSMFSQAFGSMALPKASPEFILRLESLSDQLRDLTVWRFATRLTGLAAAILVAASLHWAIYRPATPQSQPGEVAMASVSDMLDTESVATTAGTDNSSPEVQIQLISQDLSGGRP